MIARMNAKVIIVQMKIQIKRILTIDFVTLKLKNFTSSTFNHQFWKNSFEFLLSLKLAASDQKLVANQPLIIGVKVVKSSPFASYSKKVDLNFIESQKRCDVQPLSAKNSIHLRFLGTNFLSINGSLKKIKIYFT